jgi:hypothetical protein
MGTAMFVMAAMSFDLALSGGSRSSESSFPKLIIIAGLGVAGGVVAYLSVAKPSR